MKTKQKKYSKKKLSPQQVEAARRLEQIRENMTEEQAKECQNMAYEVASKAIFQAISNALAAANEHQFARDILSNQHVVAIHIPIEHKFDNTTYKLCTCLAQVDSSYQYDITVPPGFNKLQELTDNLKSIKLVAVSYWEHYKLAHQDEYERLQAILGPLTLEEVPDHPHVMRFSAQLDKHRIAPFSFWKDNSGQILARSNNDNVNSNNTNNDNTKEIKK